MTIAFLGLLAAIREYYITRIPRESETSTNQLVSAKLEQLGRFEQVDDESELVTRETCSGSLVYHKSETVVIEGVDGEACPGTYTGQWVSVNMSTDEASSLVFN